MGLRSLLLGFALGATGCVIPPAKVSGRVPLAPVAATAPASVKFLVDAPAGQSVASVGLVYAGDVDLKSVMTELRSQAAAMGADAVMSLSLSVSNSGAVSASGTAVRWH